MLLVAAAIGGVAAPANPVAAETAPHRYIEPVAGAIVVDRFRAPPTPYAAGNRGLDELTRPGAAVVASADGRVLFAGPVGGTLHVTVGHPDGLRTSYSFLASIVVRAGDEVRQGQALGTAGPFLHFGVRDPAGTYLDPELLLAGRLGAHLVPGADEGLPPLTEADERSAFAVLVAAARRGAGRLATRGSALAHELGAVSGPGALVDLLVAVERWRRSQERCTPAAVTVPPPTGRRVAVLVGGLGSSSDAAAVDRVDLDGLGYAATDVVRFSYRGGRTPPPETAGRGPLDVIGSSTYAPSDTVDDLHRSARRLRALLADVARAAPGVPIDLIAHSQGGVVARLALNAATDEGALPAGLGIVVTLGTPHRGADLATAVAALGVDSPAGRAVSRLASAAGAGVDLGGAAIAQLSETSEVTAELSRPVPAGVRLLSIGASGDLTVPAVHTMVDGADHALVHLGGTDAHDRLPGSAEAARDIGLARAGLPPTCTDPAQGLADIVTSHGIARAEDTLGLLLGGHAG